jgi:glutathione S-transferase
MVLYSGPLSMFGAKAEIALREKGVPFELVMVPFAKGDFYAPKHPDVLRINPKGQVPVLVHREVELFDSTLIFEYLEDAFPAPPLWPTGAAARAEARTLELISDDIVFANIARLFGLEETPDDPRAVAARAAAAGHYADFEARLEGRGLSRRSVRLCGYRLRHGAVLRGAERHRVDGGDAATVGVAEAHAGAAGGDDGAATDGRVAQVGGAGGSGVSGRIERAPLALVGRGWGRGPAPCFRSEPRRPDALRSPSPNARVPRAPSPHKGERVS